MLRRSLVLVLATVLTALAQQSIADSVVGDWAYKSDNEKPRSGMYAAEFIHLTLAKTKDGLWGDFHARYKVPENGVTSPDVNFELKSIDDTAQSFSWKSADGTEGTFKIQSVQGNLLRIEWRRTNKHEEHKALAKGQATLVRQ